MGDAIPGAEITKLSFLQMLTDKLTKMDYDGTLYSRLLEGRTKMMETSMAEIKDMFKGLNKKMDTFQSKIEENIAGINLANEKRNSYYDRWRTLMIIMIAVAIGIACIAMGMKIEEAMFRVMGIIK